MSNRTRFQIAILIIVGALAVMGSVVLSPSIGSFGNGFGKCAGLAFGFSTAISAAAFIGPQPPLPRHRGSLRFHAVIGSILGPLGGSYMPHSWRREHAVIWVIVASVAGAFGSIVWEPLRRRRNRNGDLALMKEQMELEKLREEGPFDLVLTDAGDFKLRVIQYVSESHHLSLDNARDLVNAVPQPLVRHVLWDEAMTVWRELRNEGAQAEIRKSDASTAS